MTETNQTEQLDLRATAELARNFHKQVKAVIAIGDALESIGDIAAHKDDLEKIIAKKNAERADLEKELERLAGRVAEETKNVHEKMAQASKIDEEVKKKIAEADSHVVKARAQHQAFVDEIAKLKKKLE